MKYEQHIVFEDGGYVGYLLKNDELVYSTQKSKTIEMVNSRLAQFFIKNKTNSIEPQMKTSGLTPQSKPTQSMFVSSSVISSPGQKPFNHSLAQVGTRRCCGR